MTLLDNEGIVRPWRLPYTLPQNARIEKVGRTHMTHAGRWTIVVMILAAAVAAALGWWYQRAAMRRTMALWGPETALVIARASRVEALRLGPGGLGADRPAAETIDLGGARIPVIERRDIGRSRGLSHLRQALLDDRSFDWQAQPAAAAAHWDYALRFAGQDRSVTLLVDLSGQLLAVAGAPTIASVAPIADGLAAFLDEQFPSRP